MAEDVMQTRCAILSRCFDKAPMKATFGMELSFDSDGTAVFRLPNQSALNHGLGDTHGGVIATLLDNAGWFSVASQYDCWINTVELSVRLLEPARQESLVARGYVVRAGKQVAVATMEVHSESGRLVAIGSGTFAVSEIPIQVMKQSEE